MRICLLTGGGYPYRRDTLGGWCRSLVQGLATVAFDLRTIADREPTGAPAYPLPFNVATARAVVPPRDDRRRSPAAGPRTTAAHVLCQGLLGDEDHRASGDMFADGLGRLARLAQPDEAPLAGVPLADVLLDSWRPALPRLSVRDARIAATLLRYAARSLAVQLPEDDLVHCVGGTTPLIAALAGHWRTGTPLLLTEARAAVARLRPAEERLSPAVRTVLSRFRRCVARAGYAEAELIAPLSSYHREWALRHGATPERLVQVPAGVDPVDYPTLPESGRAPALVWAGDGGPDSGLGPLLEAFVQVMASAPGTVLHLVGITAQHEEHAAAAIERTGLGRAIRLHPLPADPQDRYLAGQVVVHVPGPADPPHRLIEAMMSGRAVVATDVGPAAETLGDAGLLVPVDDPAGLAAACLMLLQTLELRRLLGRAARRRALARFTTDRVVRAYAALYADLAGPPPAPAFELPLAVPAPRVAVPATVRWLIREER